jgi:hypothetical protein
MEHKNLKIGVIVKICDEDVRRGNWAIGRIGAVYLEDD